MYLILIYYTPFTYYDFCISILVDVISLQSFNYAVDCFDGDRNAKNVNTQRFNFRQQSVRSKSTTSENHFYT